jgi:hypothetical protein
MLNGTRTLFNHPLRSRQVVEPSIPFEHKLLYPVFRNPSVKPQLLKVVVVMAKKKTEKQRKAHMDYFTRLGIDTSCVVCGSEDWIIGRIGPAFDVGGGRQVMPVEIICNFCGRIATYDGRVIGNV